MGYPARYVTGYYANSLPGQWSEIPASNAHAWVEIYVDGFGWVPVEVTGPGSVGNNQIPDSKPKTKLSIGTYSAGHVFSGENLSVDGFYFIENNLKEGHKLSFDSPQFFWPGSYLNAPLNLTVYEESTGKDVSGEYSIEVVEGTVEILPRKLILSTGSAHKKYDGAALFCDEYTIMNGELPEVFHLNVLMGESITEKGSVENKPRHVSVQCRDQNDPSYYHLVTHCFVIEYANIGTLTVF